MTKAGNFLDLMKERAEGRVPEMDQFIHLREVLKPFYRPGMSVLDVGCGMGHALRSLRKLDADVDYRGIDLSDSSLETARALFPGVSFEKGDIENLNGTTPADAALCFMLILHLDGYDKALENLARVGRKHLVIRTLLAPDEYRIKRFTKGGAWFWYNMYARERFVDSLTKLGYDKVVVHDSPLRHEIPYRDDWQTWTLGDRQVFGNLILPWKIIHAERTA